MKYSKYDAPATEPLYHIPRHDEKATILPPPPTPSPIFCTLSRDAMYQSTPFPSLTQDHDEVGTQLPLDLDRSLRGERLDGTVEVALEPRSLLADADQRGCWQNNVSYAHQWYDVIRTQSREAYSAQVYFGVPGIILHNMHTRMVLGV